MSSLHVKTFMHYMSIYCRFWKGLWRIFPSGWGEKGISTKKHIYRRHGFCKVMESKRSKAAIKWENMDYDILLKIFMTFSFIDLISSVSRVCSSWRSVCRDRVLWKTVDLSFLKVDSFTNVWQPYARSDWSSESLMDILKCVFSLSRGNVSCLIFHFDIYIKDKHLMYTAERFPKLKRLVLPAWTAITVDGFRQAVRRWEGLESMTIPCTYSPFDFMKAIGENCKNFAELKIMCRFDIEFATAITTFLPKLKVLSLRCTVLCADAFIHILNGLEHLEVLNLFHCTLDCFQHLEPIKVLWEDDVSILEKALRLREFLICPDSPCTTCQYRIDNEGTLVWPVFEKELLRMDEVNSLAI